MHVRRYNFKGTVPLGITARSALGNKMLKLHTTIFYVQNYLVISKIHDCSNNRIMTGLANEKKLLLLLENTR